MIECPVCHRVSHHPVDVSTGWCSLCSRFTGKTADEVRAVAASTRDGNVRQSILWRLDEYGAAEACRTPWKIRYGSRSEAKQALRVARRRLSGNPRPYLCSCSWWHTTRMKGPELRRMLRRRKAA